MHLVGVLSNPASTRNRHLLGQVSEVVDNFDGVFHFEISDIADVSLALKRFAEQGVDIIVANGGDGTIQAIFSCLMREHPFAVIPPIAVLPAGKTNMIAEDLGARQPKPHVYLQQLLELNRSGKLGRYLVKRHLLKVDGIPGEPTLYGMFFGTAGIVKGIELCRRIVYPLGLPNILSHPLAIIIMLFGTIFGGLIGRNPLTTDPLALRGLSVDVPRQRYFVITITTLNRLILGLRPFSQSGSGALKVLSVVQSPLTVARAFWAVLSRNLKNAPEAGIVAEQVERVELTLSCPMTLDGELYHLPGETTINVTETPELEFVQFDEKALAA